MKPILAATVLQLLVVATASPSATTGTMQRYERASASADWTPIGEAIPISVGANGLSKDKKEGDRKSPAGIFALGSGFGASPPPSSLWPYARARAEHVCVDDPGSPAYGLISPVDRFPPKATWSSAESLRIYPRAIVVEYNRSPPVAGRGSCIFLHPWDWPGQPTLGCTAMSAEHLDEVMGWLDPKAKPTLIQGVAPSPKSLLKTTAAR